MTFKLKTTLVAAAILVAAPAAAQQSNYVAAAYSKDTGNVGFATGHSEDSVKTTALSECQTGGASDCVVAIAGPDMCISLARATNKNRLGLGGGATRADSQSKAMSECAQNDAQGCNIHDTYCAPETIR
ncbi:DUF4189 domain-containing protein [Ancylobacter sp. MQZ15Z-1]|uniref:DUF4189 domain-containing protein n=1 Tax=Ancylobacter mangrovi TaxID=2972472 RepID=A0A9X2PQ86_9HYPH|nr:DUF4189 domain-containing protein [Ancylobacter mangrovi]MCS0497833.1 DUF4189 domain-containing protein [Ancylobacter mangrovi]